MSLLRMPVSAVNRLERMIRNFLWEGSGEGKKDHVVRWEVVSRSRLQGGLALGKLSERNANGCGDSLLSLILYGMLSLRVNMDCRVMDGMLRQIIRVSTRCLWRFISQCFPCFHVLTSGVVGKGDEVHFWESWCGMSHFLHCILVCTGYLWLINDPISSYSSPINWDFKFFRNLNDRVIF